MQIINYTKSVDDSILLTNCITPIWCLQCHYIFFCIYLINLCFVLSMSSIISKIPTFHWALMLNYALIHWQRTVQGYRGIKLDSLPKTSLTTQICEVTTVCATQEEHIGPDVTSFRDIVGCFHVVFLQHPFPSKLLPLTLQFVIKCWTKCKWTNKQTDKASDLLIFFRKQHKKMRISKRKLNSE